MTSDKKKAKQPVFIWGDPWQHPNGKSKEELKGHSMKAKEESEKACLKLNIQKS